MPDPRPGAQWLCTGLLDPTLSPQRAGTNQAGSREARGVESWAQRLSSVLFVFSRISLKFVFLYSTCLKAASLKCDSQVV